MNRFSDMLSYLRKREGWSQQELAGKLGVAKSTISMYENGARKPSFEMLEAIADLFNINMSTLVGQETKFDMSFFADNLMPMPATYKVPLLGTIACGEPILAAENIEGDVEVPEHVRADFALRCKGDSMINARIFDGDIVYIRQQPTVDDGQIAAVLIGEEATLKRVRLYPDHVVLEPENPLYRPHSFWNEDMNTVRILGKAVAFTSAVR